MFSKDHFISRDKQTRLITGCMANDRSCQSALYALYAPRMLVICMRYAKNKEEAEEILQDGFVRVFKFLGQFNDSGSFDGWVRKIMVNCALQKLKAQFNMWPVVSLSAGTTEHADSEQILSGINGKELLGLIQNLTPAYRVVFNLYVFEGLKHREIAGLLNISSGTSKSNLYEARNAIQRAMNKNVRIAKQC